MCAVVCILMFPCKCLCNAGRLLKVFCMCVFVCVQMPCRQGLHSHITLPSGDSAAPQLFLVSQHLLTHCEKINQPVSAWNNKTSGLLLWKHRGAKMEVRAAYCHAQEGTTLLGWAWTAFFCFCLKPVWFSWTGTNTKAWMTQFWDYGSNSEFMQRGMGDLEAQPVTESLLPKLELQNMLMMENIIY